MSKLTRVNSEVVKPLKNQTGGAEDKRPARGWKLIPEPYANIFACGRKKMGKTVAVVYMLKKFAGPDTIIIVFSSTFFKDQRWIDAKAYFTEKGIAMKGYTSLKDNGVNVLSVIVKDLERKAKEEQEAKEAKEQQSGGAGEVEAPVMLVDEPAEQEGSGEEKKVRKSKYITPEYIFVFDDLSDELKDPALVSLMKKNRHFRCKTIISSQYLKDLMPESRKQIDCWLLFSALPDDLLDIVYKDGGLSVDKPTFLRMYKQATQGQYHFFYCDVRRDEYRRDFTHKFHLT